MTRLKHIPYFHIVTGCLLGILLLHPITKAVYWFEFHHEFAIEKSLWQFLVHRLQTALLVEMIPMNLVFGAIGGIIGTIFGIYHLKYVRQQQVMQQLELELGRDLPAVISEGEGERTEFKSSVRWDIKQDKVSKGLEMVIAKTIVGFMNHQGGSLLVGIKDNGEVLGLEKDYGTLKHKNRDGFEQCIMDIVKSRIGGDQCPLVHSVFYELGGKDVCRVVVEPSKSPVYCSEGNVYKYYLRTGNSTRELDAREVVAHVAKRH